jgi:hypothetical protein
MATAAAAVTARARRDIQHHFFEADAVRPDRAVAFAASGFQLRQFNQMCAKGIIRKVDSGRYWFDVVAYDADLQRRHRRALIVALIALAVMLVELLLFYRFNL